jgi:ribosomal protein L11 methyltransferase
MTSGIRLWRRLVPVRLADAWVERVRWAAPASPILTQFPGKPTARLEIYGLTADAARSLQRLFGGEIRTLASADWLGSQARDFVLPIPRALVLASESASIPSRHRSLPVLRIPAGMAFGTGEHATTALCLRQLVRAISNFPSPISHAGSVRAPRVIDAGTGSGVLALAAALLGAQVEAFDFDPVCLRECRANAARNPHVPRVRWHRADVLHYHPRTPADILVANLYADLLVRALPRMKHWRAPGGVMILSGVLRTQEAEVTAALARLHLRPARILRKGKWICFAGVHDVSS